VADKSSGGLGAVKKVDPHFRDVVKRKRATRISGPPA